MIKSVHTIFYVFLILTLFSGRILLAQKRCSTVEAEQSRRTKYKLPSEDEFESWLAKKMDERRNKLIPFGTNESGEPDKIAVVVHVIYNEGDEEIGVGTNISDEQIYSQIEVLNEDYQRKNSDTLNTQAEFLDVASKMNIEFVLARQTPQGDPTTGIIRKVGPKTSYGITISDRELLSSISNWDPYIYLNIWVVNLSGQYIGLAQFPDVNYPGLENEPNKDNESTDGMVIDYKVFGSAEKVPGLDLMSSYNLGRTSTHEMGHFFGLKHVWGDDTSISGCSKGDYVNDTPDSNNDYSGLCTPSDHVSCSSNDMFENFLYYTNDACMNIFTADQVFRMETIIGAAPRRDTLLNSIGTEYPENMYVDLAINSIKSPGRVICDGEFVPVIEIKNNGTIPIIDFDIVLNLSDVTQVYSYEGDTIFTGEIVELQLTNESISVGNYKLEVELSNIELDINPSNNRAEISFVVDDQTDFIPLREQFEVADLTMTNWITINEDNGIGWELSNAPYFIEENTSAFINLYNYEAIQQVDWLISPSLDFSDAREASVIFSTSYAKNGNYNDQLRVVASKDCGVNFTDLLANFTSDELSVTDVEDFWEPSNRNDWLNHSIDLSSYAGEKSVRVAFVAINDYGNNLYLDDIEFYTTSEDNLVEATRNSYTLYPNPTTDGQFQLTFNTSERQEVTIFIYDQIGQLLTVNTYPNTLNQTYFYDLTGKRSGVYVINVQGKDFVRTKKLVISR